MQETPYLQGREHLIEKFKTIPFMKALNRGCMQEILSMSKMRKYEPGELIIQEGVFDCWFYIILGGKVRVVKRDKEIVKLETIGEVFGEMAVIDGEARSASVYAETEALCLAIDASFLERLKPVDRNMFYSAFYRLLAEILANRLRATNEELARVKHELDEGDARGSGMKNPQPPKGKRPAAPDS